MSHAVTEGLAEPHTVSRHGANRNIPGTMTWHSGIMMTRVGLRLPPDLIFDDWLRAGPKIFGIVESSSWGLGDWLVYGQDRYADRYRRAVDAAGLDYQTLRNYAWVARKFEISRRRDQLSFQHHAEVASLSSVDQELWLDRAERAGWSRNEMRRQIRNLRRGQPAGESRLAAIPRLRVAAERLERWRAAADQSRVDFNEWMIRALDQAARATDDHLTG